MVVEVKERDCYKISWQSYKNKDGGVVYLESTKEYVGM